MSVVLVVLVIVLVVVRVRCNDSVSSHFGTSILDQAWVDSSDDILGRVKR